MAILKAPVFSFEARGQLAKSLVFMGWKGLKTVRQHVDPSNPQSPAQTTQRNIFSNAVEAWRSFIRNTVTQTAWNTLALVLPGALSGFNAYMRAAIALTTTNPSANMMTGVTSPSPGLLEMTFVKLSDGTPGGEGGSFFLFAGTEANSLQSIDDNSLGGPVLQFSVPQFVGESIFYEVRKDGQSRTGIFRFTVT